MITQKRGSLEYSKERAVLIATKESAAVITQKRGSLEYSIERAVLIATKEEGSCDNLKQ